MDILKFGGTSVSSKDSLYNILRILSSYNSGDKSVIMVVSALKGVTNQLTRIINLVNNKNNEYEVVFQEIKSFHADFIEKVLPLNAQILMKNMLGLLEEEYQAYLKELFEQGSVTARDKDRILCFGELCSAQIIRMFLEVNGINFGLLDARKVILTDDNYGSANVNWPITRKRIKDFFRVSPGNYVITGFIGASAHGCTTTLGRGGSDYTATVFATILNAENVIKWTDVNGIMTADPGKVPDSYSLNKITYDQLLCLSKFGSNVLVHENSIQKLQQDNIPLIIKNTFNTNFEGTLVTNTTNTRHKAISHHTDCHIVSFQKNLKISKEVYNQIKANNYLFFRIKNDQFNQTDSSVYLVSDECLKYLSTIYCCKNPGCNSCKKPKDSKVIYESITLITIATNQKDKIFEEKRILDLLNKKGINILCTRLFKNGISLILQQEEAKDTLNYLHNEIVLRTEEKVC